MSKSYDPIEYWSNRSKRYNVSPEQRRVQIEKETKFLLSLYKSIAKGKSLSVLDIGSGYGRLFKSFKKAKVPVEMFMCDIVEGFAEVASKETGIDVTIWDGKTLPYKNMAFDVVVSFDVLLHVPMNSIDKLWEEHTRVCNDFLFIATSDGFKFDPVFGHCISHDYDQLVKSAEDFKILILKRWKRRKHKVNRLNLWLRRIHAD